MSSSPVLALAGSELRMLVRNKAVAAVAVLMPLAIGGYAVVSADDDAGGTATVAALQVLVMLTLGVYVTASTTLAARRKDLFLKRLRSGAISDTSIIAGLLVPVIVVATVQIALMLGLLAFATGAAPGNVPLLVVAVLVAALMCAGVAMATSAITPSAEQAQITTMPFLLAVIAGGIWAATAGLGELSWLKRLVPGGAVAELVVGAWSGMAWAAASPGFLALAAWATAGALIGSRFFRWEPRR